MKMIKYCILSLVALSYYGCKTTSDDFRPDVRHWGLDLAMASPKIDQLEDFINDLNLAESQQDLQNDHDKRVAQLNELQAIDLKEQSPGTAYNIKKKIALAKMREASYFRAMAGRRLYYNTNQWRLENADLLLEIRKDKDVENIAFETLEITRDLAANATFDRDENQYLLIRVMARQRSQNLLLYYDQFKKVFGTSPYAVKVNALLAANAIDVQDYTKADAMLKALMADKSSDIKPYVAFQVAWLNIAQALHETDLKKRSPLLTKAQIGLRLCLKLMKERDKKPSSLDLQLEAGIDLAWLAAEQGMGPAEAKKLLVENAAEKFYRDYLEYAAMESVRNGQIPTAELQVKELQFEHQEDRDFPKTLFIQADAALAGNDLSLVQQRYQEIRNLFKPETPWFEKWKEDKVLLDLLEQQLGSHIVSSALMMKAKGEALAQTPAAAVTPHPPLPSKDAGVKSKVLTREDYFSRSRDLIKLYAEWYPKGQALDDLCYQTALLEYHSGHLEKSIELLATIAKDKTSKHQKEATYDGMIAVSEWDESFAVSALPEAGKVKKPIPLPKSKTLLIEKIQAYLASEPQAENTINLQFSIASIYHNFGYYDKSLPLFDTIILADPKSEAGGNALFFTLNYLLETTQWAQLIEKCKTYLANKEVAGAGHRKDLRQHLEYAKSMLPNS